LTAFTKRWYIADSKLKENAVSKRTISGDESIAYGALLAGIRVATSYPGSPSSGTMQTLFALADAYGIHVEWSTNEKVAFETSVGASIGGVPALMACKGVGFNVALDPIMVANLTDVGTGLVILLGDDPGAWASQNDQDTRPIAAGTELPMVEPATPQEGVDMTVAAFKLSKNMQMPVIIRITKSFGVMKQEVDLADLPRPTTLTGHAFAREAMRWISVPTNAVELHRRLHERVASVADRFEESSFNCIAGSGSWGIIAAGYAYTKLMDVIDNLDKGSWRVLKLGTLVPLPKQTITAFMRSVDEVLVLEENEPFIETQIKAIAYDAGLQTPVHGKQDRMVSREGELFRWQIAEALPAFNPGWSSNREFSPADEKKYMPSLSGLPANCPYTPVFETLEELSHELEVEPVYVVDPGCAIKINTPPFQMLDGKYSMGSSIGIASGLVLAGVTDPVIAVVGDSDFFHLGVNALFNVAHQGSDLLVIVLDNATTALSGFQPAPGVGPDKNSNPLRIEGVAEACPVSQLQVIDPWQPIETRMALKEGLTSSGLRVLVSRSPCPYIDDGFCPGYQAKSSAVSARV